MTEENSLGVLTRSFSVFGIDCCCKAFRISGKHCDYLLAKNQVVLLLEMKPESIDKVKLQLKACLEILSDFFQLAQDVILCCIAKRNRYLLRSKQPWRVEGGNAIVRANSADDLYRMIRLLRPEVLG